MAEAAASVPLPKFSGTIIFNTIIGILLLMLIIWGIRKVFMAPVKPAGALTQAEYDALTDATVKATYHKDGDFWVKNS